MTDLQVIPAPSSPDDFCTHSLEAVTF